MADGTIAIDEPSSVDKLLDTESLTVGANTVERERVQIAGATATQIAPVSGTDGLLVNLGANNDVTVAGVATAAKQDTIIGHLDGVETLLGTIDADTSALFGTVAGSELQVDVVSSALPTGAATAAKQPALGTAGTASADVISVQGIASMTPLLVAQSGTWDEVGINDSGNSITVDGTVTAAQATAANLNATVVGTGTFAVQVSSLPASTNTLEVVGDVADDAAAAGNPVRIGGYAISPDGTDPGSVSAEADAAALRTDLNRRLLVNAEHPRSLHKHLNGTGAYTDESIAADPGDGFQIIITSIIGSTGAATAMNFFLEEGATTIFGPIYLEAVAGRGFCSGPIRLPVTASTAVTLTSSAAIAQSFDIDYYIQAV